MKVPLELPKLEILMSEAEKRGFEVTLDPISVPSYRVTVRCNGYESTGWVHENRHGKVTLDTGGYWTKDSKARVRISVHKKVAFMGNKLAWTLGGAAGEISKIEPEGTPAENSADQNEISSNASLEDFPQEEI